MRGRDTLPFQNPLDLEMWDDLMEDLVNISVFKQIPSLYIQEAEVYNEVAKIMSKVLLSNHGFELQINLHPKFHWNAAVINTAVCDYVYACT